MSDQPNPQTPPQIDYCVKCGAAIPTGARFCPQCGANQSRTPATVTFLKVLSWVLMTIGLISLLALGACVTMLLGMR